MDFQAMFEELARTPAFGVKVFEKFATYAAERNIPPTARANHQETWKLAAEAGAAVIAELVGEALAKHPFMAKQIMKMAEGLDVGV